MTSENQAVAAESQGAGPEASEAKAPEAGAEQERGGEPSAQGLKRSLRAVAQERNEARGRVRELESEIERRDAEAEQLRTRLGELEARAAEMPEATRLREALGEAQERLAATESEVRRYRVETPLTDAFARHDCAAPSDAVKLVADHVRLAEDDRVVFTSLEAPGERLAHADGSPFGFEDFARYVLERKPHLSLRPPAVGSATPGGAGAEDAGRTPDCRRDPEGYRRYFMRKYGKDPRSVISF